MTFVNECAWLTPVQFAEGLAAMPMPTSPAPVGEASNDDTSRAA